jgi:hypothetical protein
MIRDMGLHPDDDPVGVKPGERFSHELGKRLLAEEYEKLRNAGNRDVHDTSKNTTLPIAREIVETYVMDDVSLPWYIDLLNINLENRGLTVANRRIQEKQSGPNRHLRRHAGHWHRRAQNVPELPQAGRGRPLRAAPDCVWQAPGVSGNQSERGIRHAANRAHSLR